MSPRPTRSGDPARIGLAAAFAAIVSLAWPAAPTAVAQIAPAGLAVVRADDMVLGRPAPMQADLAQSA